MVGDNKVGPTRARLMCSGGKVYACQGRPHHVEAPLSGPLVLLGKLAWQARMGMDMQDKGKGGRRPLGLINRIASKRVVEAWLIGPGWLLIYVQGEWCALLASFMAESQRCQTESKAAGARAEAAALAVTKAANTAAQTLSHMQAELGAMQEQRDAARRRVNELEVWFACGALPHAHMAGCVCHHAPFKDACMHVRLCALAQLAGLGVERAFA